MAAILRDDANRQFLHQLHKVPGFPIVGSSTTTGLNDVYCYGADYRSGYGCMLLNIVKHNVEK